MIFDGFEIHASPFLSKAYCECGEELHAVSNGWLSGAFYCRKCENVYLLTKRKLPNNKLTKEFINQCRFETEMEKTHQIHLDKIRKKYKQ